MVEEDNGPIESSTLKPNREVEGERERERLGINWRDKRKEES